MSQSFIPDHGWGPNGCRAALTFSFDNLGEAADLELGTWGDHPVGEHFTAEFMATLAEVLGDVRGTYFIEASNALLYPEQIKRWHQSGNEVALHAWRHEFWNKLDAERRRAILADSMAAMARLGIRPAGFRPPGGEVPPGGWQELEAAGLTYCSDVGPPGIRRVGNMLSLPFQWHATDVYMIEDVVGFLRVREGDQEQAFTLAQWVETLDRMVDALLAEGGQRTVLFHPHFIGASDEKLGVLRRLLARATAEDIWIAPAAEVARFVGDKMKLRAPIDA